jgi:hypothetical protein
MNRNLPVNFEPCNYEDAKTERQYVEEWRECFDKHVYIGLSRNRFVHGCRVTGSCRTCMNPKTVQDTVLYPQDVSNQTLSTNQSLFVIPRLCLIPMRINRN